MCLPELIFKSMLSSYSDVNIYMIVELLHMKNKCNKVVVEVKAAKSQVPTSSVKALNFEDEFLKRLTKPQHFLNKQYRVFFANCRNSTESFSCITSATKESLCPKLDKGILTLFFCNCVYV